MKKSDPVCGMAGKISAHGEWFCSWYCVRKFEEKEHLPPVPEGAVSVWAPAFYKHKLFLTALAVGLVFSVSFFIPALRPFRHHFLEYAGLVWKALLLGFLIGGWIEVYIPRSYIIKVLAQDRWTTLLNAAILGFIFSGCSHGCLAITFELYKKGASVPAVISFLLASPWANLSITLLLFSFFQWKGLLILCAALFIAVLVGGFYQFLDRKNWIEKNSHAKEIQSDFSILKDIRSRWGAAHFDWNELMFHQIPSVLRGSWHLAEMVLWWVLIGVALAALIGSLVPENIFQQWMGKSWLGILVTLGAATVIEVCSEGSAPLAFELYRQTSAFGNTFVFLMAGVITDYTELGLLWSNIGKKTALWLPIASVPLVLLLGILFNLMK